MPSASPSFFTRPADVLDTPPIGFWGHLNRNINTRTKSGLNTNPQALEVWTIAVPATVENAAAYFVAEGGQTATHITTTTVQDDLGAGLDTQFGLNGVLSSRWTSVYDTGTNVLTFTGTHTSVSGTFTVSSGFTDDLGAPSQVTPAATADPVKFGRALVSLAFGTDTPNRDVLVAKAADFTAQVMTFTIAAAAGDSLTPVLRMNGQTYQGAAVPFNTNLATTCTDLAAEIDNIAPANVGVTGGSGATTVTATAEVAGAKFELDIIAAVGSTASATKAYTTGPSPATSFEEAFVGLSVRREDVVNATVTGDDPEYGPNEGVEYAEFGEMYVQKDSGETWALGDDAWASLLAGATAGRLYNTAAASRVWVPPALVAIQRGGTATSDTETGVISIKGA
jgi:hypothetical protein